MTKVQLKEIFDDQSAGGAVVGALVRALRVGAVRSGAVFDRARGAFSVRFSHEIAGDLVELSPASLRAAQEFLALNPRMDDTGRALRNMLNGAARNLAFAQDYVAAREKHGWQRQAIDTKHLRLV